MIKFILEEQKYYADRMTGRVQDLNSWKRERNIAPCFTVVENFAPDLIEVQQILDEDGVSRFYVM